MWLVTISIVFQTYYLSQLAKHTGQIDKLASMFIFAMILYRIVHTVRDIMNPEDPFVRLDLSFLGIQCLAGLDLLIHYIKTSLWPSKVNDAETEFLLV